MEPLLTVEEAAAHLRVSRGMLAQLRFTNKGPAYYKPTAKSVFYAKSDLDTWLAGARRETAVAA